MEGIPKVSKKTDQKSEIKVRNAENSLYTAKKTGC
jgi:hypothetical protein